MRPFTQLESRVVPLLADDVDTDQIIPARYLKGVDRSGLAEGLFAAWREDPGFILHQPATEDAQVLLAGRNFGCGSSREHAAWALLAGGFRCVVARSFADIFRNNAQRNGLLPVALDDASHEALAAALREEPRLLVSIDLERQTLVFNDRSASFSLDPFARECLLEGLDPTSYLLAQQPRIAAFEARQGDAS